MNPKIRSSIIAILILTLIVATILALVSAPAHPLTWVLVAVLFLLPVINRKLASAHRIEWKPEYSVGTRIVFTQNTNSLMRWIAEHWLCRSTFGNFLEKQRLELDVNSFLWCSVWQVGYGRLGGVCCEWATMNRVRCKYTSIRKSVDAKWSSPWC